MMGGMKRVDVVVCCWLACNLALLRGSWASEFPERECCDNHGPNMNPSDDYYNSIVVQPYPPVVRTQPEAGYPTVLRGEHQHSAGSGGSSGVGMGGSGVVAGNVNRGLDSNHFLDSVLPDYGRGGYGYGMGPESYPEMIPFPGVSVTEFHHVVPGMGVDLPEDFTVDPGLNGDPGGAILNCLLARQLCHEDTSCASILEVIPRVCGPELVACATGTVTKCQAGLRTLQAYPFFRPTCLCKEPHLDPDCNAFLELLFDHPCMVATQREKDPYPIDALPTCIHALTVCQKNPLCMKAYDEFKEVCKSRDGQCRADQREACLASWSRLRFSPLFGCICPNNQMKKRCDRIFSVINHNPCIDMCWVSAERMAVYSRFYLVSDHHHNHLNHLSTTSPSPQTGDETRLRRRSIHLNPSLFQVRALPTINPAVFHMLNPWVRLSDEADLTWLRSSRHLFRHLSCYQCEFTSPALYHVQWLTLDSSDPLLDPPQLVHPLFTLPPPPPRSFSFPSSTSAAAVAAPSALSRTQRRPLAFFALPTPMPTTSSSSSSTSPGRAPFAGRRTASSLAAADLPWENAATPLGTSNAFNATSPSGTNSVSPTPQAPTFQVLGVQPRWKNRTQPTTLGAAPSNNSESEEGTTVLSFQSTCHTALWRCQGNTTCGRHLDALLQHCDGRQCHRDLCMQALQGFYRDTPVEWSLEIAFCLCKKTDDKQDTCLVAQEKLHPDCARRSDTAPLRMNPEEDSTDVITTAPACHSLAEDCRAHPDCKPRLEFYEQACAVDALTRGCAGPPALCRLAMLGILGTELRTSCACRAGDLTAMYDCVGWQRILWLNPCVVESQRDYHKQQGNLVIGTLTSTDGVVMATSTSSGSTERIDKGLRFKEDDSGTLAGINVPGLPDVVGNGKADVVVSTETSTTPFITETATEASTLPTRFCTAAIPGSAVVLIPEGSGKRLFREDEPDCSEICLCKPGENLKCSILDCIERKPCETPVALYNHAGPAYRAYRGECLCYAGFFVCAKPDPDLYMVDVGVFLFMGYSKADEKLLHFWTKLTVQDHLMPRLQRWMMPVGNASACRLSIHDHMEENVILQARLEEFDEDRANHSLTLAKLQREIEECGVAVQRLTWMINERDSRIHEDLLLSVIKVAEFNSYMPEPVRSLACQSVSWQLPVWISTLVYVYTLT